MHLDENDVARYVDGRITEAERRNLEAHLAECRECSKRVAEVHRALKEVQEQEAPALDPEVRQAAEALGAKGDEDEEVGWKGFRSAVVVGGLALLLSVMGLLYWQSRNSAPRQLRVPAEENTLVARTPADGAQLSERPVFVCESVPGAVAYRVTLYAPDGTVLWETDTTSTRIPLPADVSLTKDRTYLWRAVALHSDGRAFRSDLQTFTYGP